VSLEPLIPYLDIPELVIVPSGTFGAWPEVPVSLKPFGMLVATGVYVGAYLTIRQARRVGLDERAMTSLITWVVGAGFIGAHLLEVVMYRPEKLIEDPLVVVRLWEGLSSFGGFVGATVGALLWRYRTGERLLPYADVIGSAFPIAWVFGRSGCSVAHDHPGPTSDLWFAVRFPPETGVPWSPGAPGRFDLGLYEMLLTIPLAVAFLILRRRARPWGFYLAIMTLYYAPLRFALDFLRVQDTRYLSLTPAQWLSTGLLALGVWMFFLCMRHAGEVDSIRPPQARSSARRAARAAR
jgi:phosphatidylglycerol:prolipoprotein diacylglycerol transferase